MDLKTNLTVSKLGPESDGLLHNLLQYYVHDMAQWFRMDTQPDGSYFYDTSNVWDVYDVYLAKAGESIAGFAIIGRADDLMANDVHEFFVIRKFRRTGIGSEFASKIWSLYPGKWVVRVFEANSPAALFWRNAIGTYSRGSFTEQVKTIAERRWHFFHFSSHDLVP